MSEPCFNLVITCEVNELLNPELYFQFRGITRPFLEVKLLLVFLFCTAVGDGERIQLENMLGVYLVLAAGGCFSVILVLIEMWWSKHGTNVMAASRTKYSFM